MRWRIDKAKIIVAGGRHFGDKELVAEALSPYVLAWGVENMAVVSGEANGADTLGKEFAVERGIEVLKFPADWDKHDRAAGHIRNAEMAEVGTHLIAFWDGKSKGTANMIERARKKGLRVEVFNY